MAAKNSDIETVQAELIKRFKQLLAVLDETTDPDLAQTIVTEIQEVNHRITLAGSRLFARQNEELSDKTAKVRASSAQAQKKLREFANAKDIMDAISGFLGIVDEAIDLAKTL